MRIKILQNDSFMIWSGNWKDLANWYEEIFDIELEAEVNLPNDTGKNFKYGDGQHLWIGYHSEVKGKSKDPFRIMPGFVVENMQDAFEVMKQRNVKIIQEPLLSPTKDYLAMTISDPDGNTVQIFDYDIKHL